MSADQMTTETVFELDDVVFDTDVPEYGETVIGIVEASTEETVKAAFQAIAAKTSEVATEDTVEPAGEATAEDVLELAAEDTVEEIVEATPEATVETPSEETTEPAVETIAEEPVEATDSAETDDAEEADETPQKRGLLGLLKSPIGMGAAAVLVLAIGGGAFFFVTSGGDAKEAELVEAAQAEHGHDEAKAEHKDDHQQEATNYAAEDPSAPSENTFENEYGSITFSGSDAIYHTAPATVSLDIGADARRLRVSVGVLTDQETAKALYSDGLTISLLQIEAVESVDFGPYREWELPGLIVSAFKTKLEEAYPDKQIRAVMIRDFQRVGT